MKNKQVNFLKITIFAFILTAFFSFTHQIWAALEKYAPGDTIVIGEFVYDDEMVATTTANCRVNIYNPSGDHVASNIPMTPLASGWNYYSTTTIVDEGIWPTTMTCGSAIVGDLANLDKTFVISNSASSTAISNAVWSNYATSSVANVINAHTDYTILAASTSLASNINANTNTQIQTASSSIVSQILSSIAGVPTAVWSATGRTLSNFGTLAADTASSVWSSVARTLTGAGLDTGSLATLSDVQIASSSIVVAINNLQTTINQNTDTRINNASTSIVALANANTDAKILAASTSLASNINANTDSKTSAIVTNVNLHTDLASSSLGAIIQTASSSIVSQILSSIAGVPTAVWSATGRTLDSFTDLATAVWTRASRTLTSANLDSGSLATNSYIDTATSTIIAETQTASSSIAAAITAGTESTNAQVLTASSSIVSQISSFFADIPANVWTYISDSSRLAVNVWGGATRTLTSALLGGGGSLATESYINTATSTLIAKIQNGWTVTLSDFGETTVNTAYKARLQVLNYEASPTDADSLPTVVITDAAGTVKEPAGVMTKDSDGTYSYSYSISGSQIGGVWETVVSVVVDGKTVKVNDYWTLSSSPADVQIVGITDKTVPTITANVKIDNKGTSASDFYYVYCVVDNEDGLCGGSDDIDSGSDTAYIDAGDYINLSLTLDEVPTAGTYWFKVKARSLAESNWAVSSEQFIAESRVITPPVNPPDSGGGGGSGGNVTVITPTITAGSCNGADFNADKKVNSVDFSILLAFWQKIPPFKNPCVDINKDSKVNSVDFSILLYEWGKK